jgi:NADH-quinone oxidoreductase subunit M
MGGIIESHLLTIVTFFPLVTGLMLLATGPRLPDALWRSVALGSSAINFVFALRMFRLFDPTRTGFQFVEHASWIPSWGIHYFVGIDGTSLVLVLLTTFLMPLVLLASWNEVKRSVRSYVFFMLGLETGMIGAFVSLNLFQFYLFWELMLVPMYFIIGIWGGPRRVYAAIKFFLFTMFGSLLMLLAMLVVYYLFYDQYQMLTLDLVALPGSGGAALLDTAIPVEGAPWWQTQTWLFGAFALAFAIKVPMVPFHTWLPDAHVEAPTAGSVILAGVLLKMGTYGFIRFGLPLFPDAAVQLTPLILALALVGIVYASLVAMVQADVKKLVAYSSVAHLGFVMLGLFAFSDAGQGFEFSDHGVSGSVLQMVNHGLSTGALFLLVGMLYERRHTRMVTDFGGVAKPMPVYAACFGVVTMSSIGLPALNGFVGEFLILLGTFLVHPALVGVIATSGVVLAACYMLWMYRRVMFGPVDKPENRGLIDLSLRERFVMLAIIVPIVWIGVHPETFLSRIRPSVIDLREHMRERGAFSVAELPGEAVEEAEATAEPETSGPAQGEEQP